MTNPTVAWPQLLRLDPHPNGYANILAAAGEKKLSFIGTFTVDGVTVRPPTNSSSPRAAVHPHVQRQLHNLDAVRELLAATIARDPHPGVAGNRAPRSSPRGTTRPITQAASRAELYRSAYAMPDATSRAVALALIETGFTGTATDFTTAIDAAGVPARDN